jgi:hypothetical protein
MLANNTHPVPRGGTDFRAVIDFAAQQNQLGKGIE